MATANPATIVRSWDASASARGVVLRVDAEVSSAYVRPGQYVEVDESFYAMARGPSRSRGELELLVRRGSWLASLRPGDSLEVSAPVGVGFPVDEVRGRPAILVGVGTGIAPLRALLHELGGTARLYYGHRNESEFVYGDELDRLAEVIRVASAPTAGWGGLVGRVQDALRERPPIIDDAIAFVCGPDEMIGEIRAWFIERGVEVFVNY